MKEVFDFIAVGSGIAGLSFSLRAARHGKVLLLTKSTAVSGSTGMAQGGIASVMSPSDSLEKHIGDTLLAGAGLCREDRVQILVNEGPKNITDLIEWGVQFSRKGNQEPEYSEFHLAKEGGHSDFRILHSEDFTGREIVRALLIAVKESGNIHMLEDVMAVDLITARHLQGESENRCYGVYGLNLKTGQMEAFIGANTLLCTGGVGQVYTHTTNDLVSTGDGIAMAFRAGATVEDMEFMQFHPTSLFDPGKPIFLISEALRGHGGKLINEKGDPFMKKVHAQADLAPRDIVARAIDEEMKKSGHPCVYLDMRSFIEIELLTHFPNIISECRARGFDPVESPIPVVPAAHFICGGVLTDENGATSLPGLYAFGETASTGVHGANRLASNSLLEALVFSRRALEYITQRPISYPNPKDIRPWDETQVEPPKEYGIYRSALDTIRATMWNYVGIVRSNERLRRAKEIVDVIYSQTAMDYKKFELDPLLIELRNLSLTAKLMIESALLRRESRGLHYNQDYPNTDFLGVHTVLHKDMFKD